MLGPIFDKEPNGRRSLTIRNDGRERKWKELISPMDQHDRNNSQQAHRHNKR